MSWEGYEFYYIKDSIKRKYLKKYSRKAIVSRGGAYFPDPWVPELGLLYHYLEKTRYLVLIPFDHWVVDTALVYLSPSFDVVGHSTFSIYKKNLCIVKY